METEFRGDLIVHAVTLIDYGMGNLKSVCSAFHFLGCDVKITSDAREIASAKQLVLPGVGSFRKAMIRLEQLGIDESIKEAVIENQAKILGICLGMQLLAQLSTEDGETKGLEIIRARVDRFSKNEVNERKIPHVGWSRVDSAPNSNLFKGVKSGEDFYFVHSYRITGALNYGVSHYCTYGSKFLAAFEHGNVYATQFHPEKSQTNGLRLIKNFLVA